MDLGEFAQQEEREKNEFERHLKDEKSRFDEKQILEKLEYQVENKEVTNEQFAVQQQKELMEHNEKIRLEQENFFREQERKRQEYKMKLEAKAQRDKVIQDRLNRQNTANSIAGPGHDVITEGIRATSMVAGEIKNSFQRMRDTLKIIEEKHKEQAQTQEKNIERGR